MALSGDFSSCDTWAAKLDTASLRSVSRRAVPRRFSARAANSTVP